MSTNNPNGLTVVNLPEPQLLDARGYKRPIATLPGYHAGRVPATKGRQYPPDPPTVAELHLLLQTCAEDRLTGLRLRAMIVLLWRTGLRISEGLDLGESDMHHEDGSIVVRRGKGGKRRVSMMDPWGWKQIEPWLEARKSLPPGPVFCVVAGPTAGTRRWNDTDVRRSLRKLATKAGIRKRIAPHQFRHAHAVELWREGVDLLAVQRQLGHARLDVTQLYLRSLAPTEVLAPIAARSAPTVSF
jgi:site-specific recombinase XerD